MKNQNVNPEAMKVRKVAKKVEPKVLVLEIGKVKIVKDKSGLTYHVPQAFSGTQLARFIESNRAVIEAFRNA